MCHVRLPVVLCLFLLALEGTAAPVGVLQYLDGPLSVLRNGTPLAETKVTEGLVIEDLDTLTTGAQGVAEVAFRPASGLTGTLRIAAQTVIRIELSRMATGTAGKIHVLKGQLALKFDKLVGGNQLNVNAGVTNLGVRGTAFEVTTAPTGEALVITSEGSVDCDAGSDPVWSLPGQAVEGPASETGDLLPLAYQGAEQEFSRTWLKTKLEGLAANAPRAFRNYSAAYLPRLEALQSAQSRLEATASAVLDLWTAQDLSGAPSSASALIQEKKTVIGPLFGVVRAAKALEWSWYRLEELRTAAGSSGAVQAFFTRYDQDKARIAKILTEAARVMKQYVSRNLGESPFL